MDVDIENNMGQSFAHFVAGAVAGTVEHCGMYPVDTLKTHIQASRENNVRILDVSRDILKTRGIRGYFNGMTAVVMGAAPAHAIYFATWEFFKKLLGAKENDNDLYTLQSGFAGVVAALVSDAVLVPMDVIKQKRQLSIKRYLGTIDCLKRVVSVEGPKALYAGYMTTIIMSAPYNFIYFPTYEALRKILKTNPSEYNVVAHVISGAGAGIFAAALTNPLDVIKTRLQIQSDLGVYYKGMFDATKTIYKTEGLYAFSRGMVPRMLFHSMSASIVWGTYEYVKYLFGVDEYKNKA